MNENLLRTSLPVEAEEEIEEENEAAVAAEH